MKHTHRINPGYEGGDYSEGNVVELTPTQHAMWHFAEWQRKGNWEDRVAWRGLAGLINSDEARLEAIRNAWKSRRTTKHTEETKRKLSEFKKGKPGHKHSDESKRKIAEAHKGRPKSAESVKKQTHAISLDWVIISPDGTVYEIRNLRAFCREYSLNQGAMSQVALGRKAAHKGWICRKKK